MKKLMTLMLVLVGTCIMAQNSPVPPQDGPEGGAPGEHQQFGGAPEGRPMPEMQKPNTQENMQALMIERIKKELDLTPEQAGKFVEYFYKGADLNQQYGKKKAEAAKKINEAMKEEKVNEGTLNGLLEEYNRADRELMEKTRELKEKSTSMLNTLQKAKLILMEGRMRGGMGAGQNMGRRMERKDGEKREGGNKEEQK